MKTANSYVKNQNSRGKTPNLTHIYRDPQRVSKNPKSKLDVESVEESEADDTQSIDDKTVEDVDFKFNASRSLFKKIRMQSRSRFEKNMQLRDKNFKSMKNFKVGRPKIKIKTIGDKKSSMPRLAMTAANIQSKFLKLIK